MKTKIVIENGETEIVLKPENEFDNDVLQKMHKNKLGYSLVVEVNADLKYGIYDNYSMSINIKENRP
jgi:hypothetical protein